MQDRVSLYPGRVKLEPVAGQANLYDLTRADQPTQEGTPLNKASLLSDATAALMGLDAAATPDGAFAALAGKNDIRLIKIEKITISQTWTAPKQRGSCLRFSLWAAAVEETEIPAVAVEDMLRPGSLRSPRIPRSRLPVEQAVLIIPPGGKLSLVRC